MPPDTIEKIIQECISARHFIVNAPLQLHWAGKRTETTHWELFHGRALDSYMTRQRATFHTWDIEVAGIAANEPLISVKWDPISEKLFVTRAVLCHAHETINAASNVIETRPATRWIRELIGGVDLTDIAADDLIAELQIQISQAVYGTGRLPLTSLETPLPQFLFGQLGYFSDQLPLSHRRLELVLRAESFDAQSFVRQCDGPTTLGDLRTIMLNISLSPYTGIVGRMLALLQDLSVNNRISLDDHIGFLNWLLQLQWRHLNAYDLKTFHHRGANYPDALLVDEVMRELLAIADRHGEWFFKANAKQRRGIRLGWFLRLMYAGQPAPESPTSPGENLRVLPTPRVPEEQIFQTQTRPRRLFDALRPLTDNAEKVLALAITDLQHIEELAELGTALVLDRPLGIGKVIGEPDATPMLAHVVHSRKLAKRNLAVIRDKANERWRALLNPSLDDTLDQSQPSGITIQPLRRQPRPGVVSIEDLFQTADDFQIIRTTKKSVTEFIQQLNLPAELIAEMEKWRVILPVATTTGEVLQIFDKLGNNWLTIQPDLTQGYAPRRGMERPMAGVRIVR